MSRTQTRPKQSGKTSAKQQATTAAATKQATPDETGTPAGLYAGGLVALGVSISIDDFGTGYSSLSYLRRLPIDNLKIDQSFLEELEKDSNTMPLVQAIVALAHGLGLSVVAEGVEKETQLEALRAVGCDKVQGYLIGGPVPGEAAELLLGRSDRTVR